MANRSPDEDVISNPKRRMSSDSAALKIQDGNIVIATWNMRTRYQAGKLDSAIQEMKNMKIDILGLLKQDGLKVVKSGMIVIQYCTQVDKNTEMEYEY